MAGNSDGTVFINTLIDTKGFGKGMNTMQKQMSGLSSAVTKLGGIIATVFVTGKLAQLGKEAIELGSDLQEVQNVVDVTFTTMSDKVNEFAKGAAEAAGLSETMAKKYMGTFGAMSKSFGFIEEEAFAMSSTLTQMVGDVASFYNLTQDEAYTKLKSVFTGETESLKDLGVVMTQSALDSYAMAKGYSKATKEMSEQEKVALRYSFVMDQLSSASGDFVRTSDGWANQMRILNLNFDSFKANIGQALINIFTPFLKVINQIVAKMAELSSHFVAFSEMLVGKSTSGGGGSPGDALAEIEDGYADIADATDEATKAQKKYLTGLDEIRTFQTPQGTDSGVSGGIGAINSNEVEEVNENIEKTESLIDRMINKISDLIKNEDWEGLGSYISDGIIKSLDFLSDKIGEYDWEGLGNDIGEFIKGIKWLDVLDSVGELIWEGINAALETWKGAFDTAPIETAIVTALAGMKLAGVTLPVSFKIALATVAFAPNIAKAIGEKLGIDETIFGDSLEELDWNYFFEKLQEGFTDASGKFSITAGIKFVLEVLEANVIGTADLLGLSDSENPLVRFLFSPTEELLRELPVGKWLEKNIVKPITEKTDGLWENISNTWNTVSEWFSTNVIEPVVGFFVGFGERIGQIFDGLWIIVQAVWKVASTWFNYNVVTPIVGFFEPIITKIGGFFSQLWEDIKEVWNNVSEWFSTYVVEPIQEVFSTLWSGIKETFASTINAIISGIESAINFIINGINGIVGGFNKIVSWAAMIAETDWGGVDLIPNVTIPRVNIPMLASGAVIPPNAPFLAMLGDQKHGTNIEAPLDTIKQAVREVVGNGGSNGVLHNVIQINRRTLLDEMIDEAKLRQSTTGRNIFDLA